MARGPIERWLDVGTGEGPFVSHALSRFPNAKVTINDIDPEALEAARKHFAALGVDRSRYSVDSRNLATTPVGAEESETFDVCTLISAIEHFPGSGDMEFLDGLWPFLKKGGRAIVTIPAMAYYEENNPIHYSQGTFERRYDPRAIYGRLQRNGYRVEDLVYLHHGRTFLARALARKYGNLNNFFGLWYKGRFPIHRFGALASLAGSMLLVDRRPVPGDHIVGAMLVLRKVDRRPLDALDSLTQDPFFRLGDIAEVDPRAPIRIFSPTPRVRIRRTVHEGDFIAVPVFVCNYDSTTLGSDSPDPACLGVHLVDPEGGAPDPDYARFPFDRPIPPGAGMFMSVNVPIAMNRPYRLIFDALREDGTRQRERGGEVAEIEAIVE